MLIGFTSRLICFRTFWSVLLHLLLFLFFFPYASSGEICVFTCCISTVFKFVFFFAAAGSLDKEEQSKPLVCLKKKESETLKKTKWRYRRTKEKCLKRFFFFCLLRGSQLTESFVPRPTHRGTVCLAHLAFTWTYQANGPTFYECTSSYGFSLLHRVIRHDNLSPLSTYC